VGGDDSWASGVDVVLRAREGKIDRELDREIEGYILRGL
jgi:hypothetical protein